VSLLARIWSRYWFAALWTVAACHQAADRVAAPRPAPAAYLVLGFDDLFERGSGLEPTARLLAARGQRVRVVGFMARMERPPTDGFYLTRRPLFCDEGGGGTADLPPDAIRVQVVGRPTGVAFIPGPIAIIGVLQLGAKEHPDGAVSHVRILLLDGSQTKNEKESS
jgi:hypothetical protein